MEIKGYRVQNEHEKTDNYFEIGSDWLKARQEAVEMALSLKDIQHSYKSIRLSLEYIREEGANETVRHWILTGKKMPTEIILDALNVEHDILRSAHKGFDVMVTTGEDHDFYAVNQHFIKLYYFTAT